MTRQKIYIAAPLFSQGERAFNERIGAVLRALGHETFLPRMDCAHMDWCDTLLFVMDGRVPDEGACFELGYAYAKGKRCIGYKTDVRSFIGGYDNVMLCGAPERVLRSEEELKEFFAQEDR